MIIGAGVSGLPAARKAREKGTKVAVVDKSHPSYSGSGGAGVDHWHDCCTNPACKLTPEEYTNAVMDNYLGWGNGAVRYISARDSCETLLELEGMGMKIHETITTVLATWEQNGLDPHEEMLKAFRNQS